MVSPTHQFHLADYVVFSLTIVVSLGIGVYYAVKGRRKASASEYLVGGRKMKIIPVALSLMVSFESSIMMLGFPAEVYIYGIMFWLSTFGFMFANLIGTRLIVPMVHPLRLTSAYEYLQLRFKSRMIRQLGTTLAYLSTLFYMGIVLFGPAIALEAVTGFPLAGSMAVVACASVCYTTIGGFKAVIWTDVFQTVVMLTGMFAILIKGTMEVGGPTEMWNINYQNGRLNFFDFNPDPTVRHTFWSLFLGSSVRMIGLTIGQAAIQRISSTPTELQAKKVLLITGPAFFITLSLATLEGLVAFAYYYDKGCDPLKSKQITNPNQIIPFMVMDIFRNLPGMPGLFMAALFSASLSTLSSGLSGLSAQTWEDYVKPYVKNPTEVKATIIAKCSVVACGGVCVAISLLIAKVGGTLSQISFSLLAAFSGPATGLFILGAIIPWANIQGAFVATVTGAVFIFWISIGSYMSTTKRKTPWLPLGPTDRCQVHNVTYISGISDTTPDIFVTTQAYSPEGLDKLYSMSYMWFGALGIFFVIVTGAIASYMFNGCRTTKMADTRYLVSVVDQLFCCLPEPIKLFFRCGVDYSAAMRVPESSSKADMYHTSVDIPQEDEPFRHPEEEHSQQQTNHIQMTHQSGDGPESDRRPLIDTDLLNPHQNQDRNEPIFYQGNDGETSSPDQTQDNEESFPDQSQDNEESFPDQSQDNEESFPDQSQDTVNRNLDQSNKAEDPSLDQIHEGEKQSLLPTQTKDEPCPDQTHGKTEPRLDQASRTEEPMRDPNLERGNTNRAPTPDPADDCPHSEVTEP
ncbi:sodium-coupled monocarboxylate transporter 1-like [Haliotis cracherodii]|uniref:sodium-coupled monocarboxylate transporter 1-like n=1 Tax=Haliotis cracherodii TaxID=6455 RepID=UPI0039EC337C